jgi:ssDNA-binding Zn-finger/Zn-ribbon topoisomerase 1
MFDDSDSFRSARTQADVEAIQQALRDAQLDIVRLTDQVRLQRKVIEKLVQFVAGSGGAAGELLKDKEVRELLNLAPEQPGSGRVVGKLRCPACNSVVDDKEGDLKEKCPWCGEQLSSKK